ncbi:hypothetical protein D3C76_1626360 [compost metagenome]
MEAAVAGAEAAEDAVGAEEAPPVSLLLLPQAARVKDRAVAPARMANHFFV